MDRALSSLAIALLAACGSDNTAHPDGGTRDAASLDDSDPFAGLPAGAAQLAVLCARGHGDTVARAFCATTGGPPIASIAELQRVLGIDFKPGQLLNGQNGNPAFALTAHSTSLAIRSVSQINPRAIIFTPPASIVLRPTTPVPNPTFVVMGFARGEQTVELISKDPSAGGELRFYLFAFRQACNATGCIPADLLTSDAESGFTRYSLYEDVDIANTQYDCMECHQPAGPGTPRILRMQELQFPWTHWISNSAAPRAVGNNTLRNDYVAAHPFDEAYAGIPGPMIETADRSALGANLIEAFVENNGFMAQPNEYLDQTILDEVIASNPAEPQNNVPPGKSATWNGLYARYLAGDAIPPPYHDERTTDAARLSAMITAYRAVATGAMPRAALPDIRDVVLDAALPDMTLRPPPGATGREILVQMCRQCHNARLDRTLSRASFEIDALDTLSRAEKDLAIARLQLPRASVRHMPPVRLRELSEAEIALAVAELAR